MAILNVVVDLPERKNTFFNSMALLLPKQIFNVDPDFMVPTIDVVAVSGTVVPYSTVKVFINGRDQSPVPDIVADADGAWSGNFLFTPGQNTVQVQFFPPELTEAQRANYVPTLLVNNVLVHPTLFSAFAMVNSLQMIKLDGNYLYLGNYVPPPSGTQTLARFDITTGLSTVLDLGVGSPLSGRVYYMDLDVNWLYVAQTMGDSSIKLSRYAKNLSAKTDLVTATVANSLHSDGTNLFYTRTSGGDTKLGKVTAATMALVGSELSLTNGNIGEGSVGHNQMTDNGTSLMIPATALITGDGPGNAITDGAPGMGGALALWNRSFYARVVKSTMVKTDYTLENFYESASPYVSRNSLIALGGFYYTLAQCNPARIVKLQEVPGAINRLVPVDAIPLPFSAVDALGANALPPKMVLGPDSRIYVAANGWTARWTPGATSLLTIQRGGTNLDVTASNFAVIDSATPTRALEADIAIFTDRAATYNITAPATPPANVRCHWNGTHGAGGVAWDPTTDGSAVLVEASINGGTFAQVGGEYFGNAMFVTTNAFQAALGSAPYNSGDTATFRVRSTNTVGVSGYSSTATVALPFLSPPYTAPSSLTVGSITTSAISLSWTNNEALSSKIVIYRSTNNISFAPIASVPFGTSTYTATGLTSGTLYYFYVKTENAGGIGHAASAASNTVSATTLAPLPPMPINFIGVSGWDGTAISWTPGIGIGDGPIDIAFDGANMWVANNGSNSVSKIAASGAQSAFPITGVSPSGITFVSPNMWTVNGDNSVTKVTPLGASTNFLSPGVVSTLTGNGSAAYNSVTGDIWMVGTTNDSVARITQSTGAIAVFGLNGGVTPRGIAFDGVNMWTANSGNSSVTKITPAGVATTYSNPGTVPFGIAFDGTNMWTANSKGSSVTLGSVTKITPAGAMSTFASTGNYSFGISYHAATGNIWVTNQVSNNITVFNSSGAVVTTYAVTGASSPSGIAYNSTTTDMWLTCQGGSTIAKITAAGVVTNYGSVSQCLGIAFDGTNMWTNDGNWGIAKITPAGVITTFNSIGGSGNSINLAFDGSKMWLGNFNDTTFQNFTSTGVRSAGVATETTFMSSPRRIASDGVNTWTANSNNTVTKITPAGVMTTYPVGLYTTPVAIAYDGTNMWTANQGNATVSKITPAGAVTSYALTGGATQPTGIAYDGANMWTANYGNASVSKITPAGVVTTFTGTGTGPADIAHDGASMWTANIGSSSVTKVTAAGVMSTFTGTGSNPSGIAFDGVNMWTTNEGENSVTKITPAGAMTTYPTGYGGGPITGYAIERSINNGGSFSPLITVGVVTSYADADSVNQSQVMYRIHAVGPGGNSPNTPNSANFLAPGADIPFMVTMGALAIDASSLYTIGNDAPGVKVGITRINLANSSSQFQNLSVYTPVGSFAGVNSAIMFGGFLYVLIKDQGEASCRILKVDTSTLTVSSSLLLTTAGTVGVPAIFTDGVDCWVICGINPRVTRFSPTLMTELLVGPALGSNFSPNGITAFGGNIYLSYRNQNTFSSFVARIATGTLAAVETVASNFSYPAYATNDGTSIYVKGTNAGSSKARVEKYTTGPLALSAQTADLGSNAYPSMVYESGSNAIYMQQQSTGGLNGMQKVSVAPAFVSFLANNHLNFGYYDGAKSDGTYVYINGGSGPGYIARKLISLF